MKKEIKKGYIKELFNEFCNYLCNKYDLDIKASLKTYPEYYKKEIFHKPLRFLKRELLLPFNNLGFYNYIDDEIVVFLKKELCNNESIPILLHVLSHELRHKMQVENEQSIYDMFIFYMEDIISYYEHNYYIKNHDLFYSEIDADKWGLNELREFDEKMKNNKHNESLSKNIDKRIRLFDPSITFDTFNKIIPKISSNYYSIWEFLEISMNKYNDNNKRKVINIMKLLYNYEGKLIVNPYNINELDNNIKGIVTNSITYKAM